MYQKGEWCVLLPKSNRIGTTRKFMKKYYSDCEKVIIEVICNGCGKIIPVEKGIAAEDYISVQKIWGYFSNKDGEYHSWELCEQCYDRIVKQFSVPFEKKAEKELL